jgi:hypothetical protein
MHVPAQPSTEYCIHFQAFLTSPELSEFLLSNRFERVKGMMPSLTQVRVIIQGDTTAKPHHVTSLACLLEEYKQGGAAILFEDGGSAVYRYLEQIGFFARWQPGYSFDMESLLVPVGSTSFVLWQVNRETLDTYANSAYQHYYNSFFQGKDLSSLTTYLAELFNNAADHAFASEATERIAFGFLQYYPSRRRLFISVSDFGMGIPSSVNRFLRSKGEEPIMASEAVKKALKLNFTVKSQPYNRGWGLHTISTGIELLRGQLAIQTSRVIYVVLQNGKKILHNMPDNPFPGTTASITMFYDELPDAESTILDEDASLF